MNFLTPFSDAIAAYENPNAVLACNDALRRRGLSISPAQAKALCETRENALRQTARIEFRGGTLEKLIDAFSDSDFVRQDNFVELLQELIDLFYASRNEIPDAVSDDELIAYMKRAFNGACAGSIELLAGRELPTLYRRLRAGETFAQSMEKLS